MDTKQHWSRADLWLAARLSLDAGGDFAQNIMRDADAAGFSRQELSAAYSVLKAETTENDCWQLNADRRAYWRNHALLHDTKPVPLGQRPTFSAVDVQAAVLRERARCEAILSCDAAKGRPALAKHYAFQTSDSLADVVKALASMPLEASFQQAAGALPPKPVTPLAAAPGETVESVVARIMNAEKMPALYAATPLPHADPSETVESVVARIMFAGK
jgi:hypothetical protein